MTLREIATELAENAIDLLEAEEYFDNRILDQDEFDVLSACIADAVIEAVEGRL